jgi:hypothetical protein
MNTQDVLNLQIAIDQSNVRRATELSLTEKFRLGADLYDDGIRWMKKLLIAQKPEWTSEQIEAELDRRRMIKRRIEEAGIIRTISERDSLGDV